MRDNSISGIDLFSGAGGLSLGAEMANIKVKYAVENEKNAATTYRLNHKETILIEKDIRCLNTTEMKVDKDRCILFGGAPCQGFSTSNRRTSNHSNPQNWLFKEFIRFLKGVEPEFFVFENVTGIARLDSGGFLDIILEEFKKNGYTCSYDVLNAADFGVPQHRKRMFIVGSRSGLKIELDSPTKQERVTVQEAFQDLPVLENGASIDEMPYSANAANAYSRKLRGRLDCCTGNLVSRNAQYVLDRYQYIKQGDNWTAIPEGLMGNYSDTSKCHTGIYYRLRADQPSIVIGNYRKNMLIHPFQDRGLSVREAARLQSFPDNYVFTGGIGFQQQQVGNAVPPILAKHVFNSIVKLM